MVNPNNSPSSEFQSLLYYKFTFNKEYSKDEAAIFLNKAPDTIQKYCSGRLAIPIDAARDLIKFVYKKNPNDFELIRFFLPSGILAIHEVEIKSHQKATWRDKLLKISSLLGDAVKEFKKAKEDGRINKNEYKPIHKLLTEMRRVEAELDKETEKEIKL